MNESSMKGSSSQRSVYDYPEHLNPFYEDENHKRLRFWKIGRPNRSNSFSIDGLKGLWSFKTFKLKKKSSMLGVNKTSESPPMLRRDMEDRYGSQATFDGRMRHTVDIGLGNNSFQRGAPCRSSLQDLNSSSSNQAENFFIRNNRYRSTVQASGASQPNRYQSCTTVGSVTPVLNNWSRYNKNQSTMSRGSSQLSVNSTNPFDDDYETISQVGSPERTSIARHSGRKKRRAPQPPVSPIKTTVVATVDEESRNETETLNETVNITNLTAEIESFVRTADTEKETIIDAKQTEDQTAFKDEESGTIRKNEIEDEKLHAKYQQTSRESPESNEYYPEDDKFEEITVEKIQNLGSTDFNVSNERCKKSPVKILIRAPTDEDPMPVAIDDSTDEFVDKDKEREVLVESQKICIEEPVNENNSTKVDDSPEKDEENTDKNDSVELQSVNESTTPTSSAVEFILESDNNFRNESNLNSVTELKITESCDDLTKIGSEEQSDIVEAEVSRSINFEVHSVPLKSDSPELRKKEYQEPNGMKKEPPTPPQRRRSVKEIIESINKCQSLLKFNQDIKTSKVEKDKINSEFFHGSTSSKSFKNNDKFNTRVDRNMNDLAKKQYENKKMFDDVSEVNNNAKTDDLNYIPVVVERFYEFNNNNDNNTARSNKEKVSNVEWNPVPKPRRHRNSTQGSIK